LDLRWTAKGLENIPNRKFHDIRKEAIAFAQANGLTFFPPNIIDRLVPKPVGPVYFVEGQLEDVKYVVARYNGFGCVKAQYFDYIADDEALKGILDKLFVQHGLSPPDH
jgi:hypothetical protein